MEGEVNAFYTKNVCKNYSINPWFQVKNQNNSARKDVLTVKYGFTIAGQFRKLHNFEQNKLV